ncbi:hypothetical protein AAC861_002802 [Vibrio cholerae]
MNFIDILKAVVGSALGLISLLFTMAFIFLIWGAFNGFNWDLSEFATKIGYSVMALVAVCYVIYLLVNRAKQQKNPKQKQSSEWDKL